MEPLKTSLRVRYNCIHPCYGNMGYYEERLISFDGPGGWGLAAVYATAWFKGYEEGFNAAVESGTAPEDIQFFIETPEGTQELNLSGT